MRVISRYLETGVGLNPNTQPLTTMDIFRRRMGPALRLLVNLTQRPDPANELKHDAMNDI